MSTNDHSHARRNQLTGEWVLVSPHRTLRPWQGQIEEVEVTVGPAHDPNCYLCPGNERANGHINPDYLGTFVFDNDFPALSGVSHIEHSGNSLFESRPESGCCRVVCYSERHDLRLATMASADIEKAIQVMTAEFCELDAMPDYGYVQIFENRGKMMGCSNSHPHAQIWATQHLPNEPRKELAAQQEYFDQHDSVLLIDYMDAELADGKRIVIENAHFVALVPYWAVWPFETLVLPRAAISSPDEMRPNQIRSLAELLKQLLSAYDGLFAAQAPYSMGFHPRPSDGKAHPEWQFHAHIYPPLLRSASVRKHLVGFEMLAMPQRDLTPEIAAEKLRAVSSNSLT